MAMINPPERKLAKRTSVQCVVTNGDTPLHVAAQRRHIEGMDLKSCFNSDAPNYNSLFSNKN